jgi:hypothetical protein
MTTTTTTVLSDPGFDLLDALFTNLNAVSSFHPGIVHDDSELSDSSSAAATDSDHDRCPNHQSEESLVSESTDRFHIDLARFTTLSESMARYHRYRSSIIRCDDI